MPLFDDNQKAVVTNLLPKYLSPERFFSLCELANRSYQLRDCTPGSILNCLIQAAEIGLEPNTPLQHCYLIPFRNNKTGKTYATLVVGWRGLVHKAIMCGSARRIVAGIVREGDVFKYRPLDPLAPILHEPGLNADDSKTDDITGAYAVAFLPEGDCQAEYMSRTQIDRIRAGSKAANDGPWVTHFAEMARKCPTRRLAKYLRMTGDMGEVERFNKALHIDNLFDSPEEDDDKPPAITAEPPKQEAPKRGRPPKNQEPQAPAASAVVPPSAVLPTCGFCKKPGHGFNDCPENQSLTGETVIQDAPHDAMPAPNGQSEISVPAGATPDAGPQNGTFDVLSEDQQAELMTMARTLRPKSAMTWLAGILEKTVNVGDLSEVPADKMKDVIKAMQASA